jgi:glycosyltransferase involved in cell wall biosynthesis
MKGGRHQITKKRNMTDKWRTELTKNANGGTELMMMKLYELLPEELLSKFQIIPSRLCELDETKRRVLYCHDLAHDPANEHLKNNGWNKFHRIVFVSHYQRDQYINLYKIPYSKTAVLQNAIHPILNIEKLTDKIQIIYHTTPQRGLNILIPVIEKVVEKLGPIIHLDVFSSFKIYGWEEKDKEFKDLYSKIEQHPNMTYHGSVSNEEVRHHIAKSHIFAYPSTWPETSCISLIEAMSAGCICIHPNLAALPETAANFTWMYNFHEDQNTHANIFYQMLTEAITTINNTETKFSDRTSGQVAYTNLFYSWEMRKNQWINFLKSFENEPTVLNKGPVFSYRT